MKKTIVTIILFVAGIVAHAQVPSNDQIEDGVNANNNPREGFENLQATPPMLKYGFRDKIFQKISSKNYFSLMFSNFVRWSLQSERQILYNLSISTVNYEKTIDL